MPPLFVLLKTGIFRVVALPISMPVRQLSVHNVRSVLRLGLVKYAQLDREIVCRKPLEVSFHEIVTMDLLQADEPVHEFTELPHPLPSCVLPGYHVLAVAYNAIPRMSMQDGAGRRMVLHPVDIGSLEETKGRHAPDIVA